MSRVEVIIETRKFDWKEERFVAWSIGYLRGRFKVVQELCMNNCTDVVSVIEGDMFKVFGKYWREAKRMKEILDVDVPVAVCGSSKCIDLSEDGPYMWIMSKYRLNKLVRVKNMLKKLIGNDRLDKVSTMAGDGIVTLNVEGCFVDLYVDEVVVLSGLLLEYLYYAVKLDVVHRLYEDVARVFKGSEIGVEVDVKNDGHGFHIWIDTCNMYLTYEEVLQFVYLLLDASIWQIETE